MSCATLDAAFAEPSYDVGMTDAYTPAPRDFPASIPIDRSGYVLAGVWSGMVLAFFVFYVWLSASSGG